ncbi:MAG: DUF4363 family protein [Huintestinicola sp.]
MIRVKIAVWLMFAILAYSIASLFILDSQNDKLKAQIYKVQKLYDSGDMEGALRESNELNDLWHDYEKIVTVIIHDDQMDQLNVSIARITPLIADGSDELTAEIQSLYHEIDQLYESEFPTWYNIL